MPLNKHVMTNTFRLGLIKVYRNALIDAKIGADTAQITAHIYGAVTVTLTEPQLIKLRAARKDMEELSGHTNAGRIEILLPEGVKFVENNRPTLTDEERAAKNAKGEGRGVTSEEAERRRKSKERMAQLLKERFGIDLSENKADAANEADADETEE